MLSVKNEDIFIMTDIDNFSSILNPPAPSLSKKASCNLMRASFPMRILRYSMNYFFRASKLL